MKKNTLEMTVGVFMAIGIILIAYMTIRLGKMEILGNNNYSVTAKFESVSGLKSGAAIEMAGVVMGRVGQIQLDTTDQVALVELKIRKEITLSDDVIASVKTSGLIGDKYIKLSPGGSDDLIQAGGVISETESSLDIEDLISKYVFGGV